MDRRILNMLIVMSFIVALGCEFTTHLRFPACREWVKWKNTSLRIAIRVAVAKYGAGTPVLAKEIKEDGHSSYQVAMQGPSGKPTSVNIAQRMVDDEKLVEPLSSAQCKALEEQVGKEEYPIVTAIRLAEEQLNGAAQEAVFVKVTPDRYAYSVYGTDSIGQQYRVLVDAVERTVIKKEEIRQ